MDFIILSIINPCLALVCGILTGWIIGLLIDAKENNDYKRKDLYFKNKVRDFIKEVK